MDKFLRADTGGAQFAHNDSGRSVSEHSRIGKRCPSRDGKSQNAQDGVASSGKVKDLSASCAGLDPGLADARVGYF
jgi:hypothetical protein